MKTVDDLAAELGGLGGVRVLVRSDLNVPLDGSTVTDDGRIRASVPTLADLAERGARVVVCAHLGRPEGRADPAYRLAPVGGRLSELLGRRVAVAADTVGEGARRTVDGLGAGEVALLENLRFEPGETSKDDGERGRFADRLAALAEAYVGDGFGAVHRRHASVYDVPRRLPHAAGGLVCAEVEVLHQLVHEPRRPYVVVLGGAKVSDKLGVIDNLIGRVDRLLIGGGMAFTFLAAQGLEVGRSLLEADHLAAVRGHLEQARDGDVELVLPVDVVAATALAEDADRDVYDVTKIPADRIGLDIGPRSAELFADDIRDAGTVFWNGPMGVFETAPFAGGTRAVARAVTEVEGLTVVGGGDTAAAVRRLGFDPESFGHISTGGGASLELLEGRSLPGLCALEA